eukprot:201453_1
MAPTTTAPTTMAPTTMAPTTMTPTTSVPTTAVPTTSNPTTSAPTVSPVTQQPTTISPTAIPTTAIPTTATPTSATPTTANPTTFTPTNVPTTSEPTSIPTVSPTFKLLICPEGSRQIGPINSDITGCGIEPCGNRYLYANSEQCLAHCKTVTNCIAFNWSPISGHLNHENETVCSLYNTDISNQMWGPNTIFCAVVFTNSPTTSNPTTAAPTVSPTSVTKTPTRHGESGELDDPTSTIMNDKCILTIKVEQGDMDELEVIEIANLIKNTLNVDIDSVDTENNKIIIQFDCTSDSDFNDIENIIKNKLEDMYPEHEMDVQVKHKSDAANVNDSNSDFMSIIKEQLILILIIIVILLMIIACILVAVYKKKKKQLNNNKKHLESGVELATNVSTNMHVETVSGSVMNGESTGNATDLHRVASLSSQTPKEGTSFVNTPIETPFGSLGNNCNGVDGGIITTEKVDVDDDEDDDGLYDSGSDTNKHVTAGGHINASSKGNDEIGQLEDEEYEYYYDNEQENDNGDNLNGMYNNVQRVMTPSGQ